MPKLRVGVLMGGMSIEREVSFNSGRTICDHLDTARYEVIPLFQTEKGLLYILPEKFLYRGKIADFLHRLPNEAQKISWTGIKQSCDFIYIATHGRYAEDGTLQGMLEVLGIPYLGSGVFSSALCMNKIMQKTFLRAANITVAQDLVVWPDQLTYYKENPAALANRAMQSQIAFPCIVKPNEEGSSLGITVVHNPEELYDAVLHAATIYPHKKQPVLIEEKIVGMEFSCITLVDYKKNTLLPLPPTEIVPEEGTHFFDYEQKYMPGRATKFTPPRCSPEIVAAIQKTCTAVMNALDITTIARIDGLVKEDGTIVIIDPNTLSGMAPSSFLFRQAAEINMSHTQLINHLIETELNHYGIHNATATSQEQEKNPMSMNKMRVAVLFGGRSNEREISLESGRNIFYKLSPHKYQGIAIFVDSKLDPYIIDQSLLVRNSTKEIEEHVTNAMKISWESLPEIADFVFIGLHGGEGENGSVQGVLETLGLPYNGSGVLASALCMDKYKTAQFLHAHGFQVPTSILIGKKEWAMDQESCMQRIIQKIAFPLIVKPHDDGCSVMVQKITNETALMTAINSLFENAKEYALIEECIQGMELTVGVIGNENPMAMPPSQAVTAHGILSIEEKFLPGAGENQTPAPLPEETLIMIRSIIAAAYKTVQCAGYARIDCFYQTAAQSSTGKERLVILEINSLPGMTPATCIFHQAAELGIKPMDFIDTIIQLGIQQHEKEFGDLHTQPWHHDQVEI